MKTNRKSLINQRDLVERKVRRWTDLRGDSVPRSGWIKAVRGALGMNTRQLAERVGIEQSNITRLEEREPSGNVTLERLSRVAKAMNCRLVYAIVPDDGYNDLGSIINERATNLAQQLVQRTEHSMRLEKQGAAVDDDLVTEVRTLANELKSKLDSRIWGQAYGTH
jgi:predicted DNA-binding mobile mystery protein A